MATKKASKEKSQPGIGLLEWEILSRNLKKKKIPATKSNKLQTLLSPKHPTLQLVLNPRSDCLKYTAQMEKDGLLCVIIDPKASLEDINLHINKLVKVSRNCNDLESKRNFKNRRGWLRVVDKVEKQNPKPTRNTFIKCFGTEHEIVDTKIVQYCMGKILLDNPVDYVYRPISSEEIEAYQEKHKLKTSRKKQ